MGVTAIVSYPLAWLMDQFASKSQKDEYGIFSNDDLAALVKYHERSQKNGGKLGQDTSRIMLGALNLDSRKIGGEIHMVPPSSTEESERDPEKANLFVVQSMIVKWPMVKTINVNDKVDKAFIRKIRMWSYSRIPVVGESEGEENRRSFDSSSWNGTKIFGFLHVKVWEAAPGTSADLLTPLRISLV
jgi:metal transporter CNNM